MSLDEEGFYDPCLHNATLDDDTANIYLIFLLASPLGAAPRAGSSKAFTDQTNEIKSMIQDKYESTSGLVTNSTPTVDDASVVRHRPIIELSEGRFELPRFELTEDSLLQTVAVAPSQQSLENCTVNNLMNKKISGEMSCADFIMLSTKDFIRNHLTQNDVEAERIYFTVPEQDLIYVVLDTKGVPDETISEYKKLLRNLPGKTITLGIHDPSVDQITVNLIHGWKLRIMDEVCDIIYDVNANFPRDSIDWQSLYGVSPKFCNKMKQHFETFENGLAEKFGGSLNLDSPSNSSTSSQGSAAAAADNGKAISFVYAITCSHESS